MLNCSFVITGVQLLSRQGCNRNFDSIYFLNKKRFSLFTFEVDFALKMEDN